MQALTPRKEKWIAFEDRDDEVKRGKKTQEQLGIQRWMEALAPRTEKWTASEDEDGRG
jgi:hypothetical protein